MVPLAQATGSDRKNQNSHCRRHSTESHCNYQWMETGAGQSEMDWPRIAGHNEGVNFCPGYSWSMRAAWSKISHTLHIFHWNWKRPQDEVSMLMRLIVKALRNRTERLHQMSSLQVIGEFNTLPDDVSNDCVTAMEVNEGKIRIDPCACIGYSGRWILVKAIKEMSDDFIQEVEERGNYWRNKSGHIFDKRIFRIQICWFGRVAECVLVIFFFGS